MPSGGTCSADDLTAFLAIGAAPEAALLRRHQQHQQASISLADMLNEPSSGSYVQGSSRNTAAPAIDRGWSMPPQAPAQAQQSRPLHSTPERREAPAHSTIRRRRG